VIDAVAEMLQDQLDMSIREGFDSMNKHKYTYSITVTAATLARYLVKDWQKFTDGLKQGSLFDGKSEGEQVTEELLQVTGASDLEGAMRMAADQGCKENLTVTIIHGIWSGIFKDYNIDITDFSGTPGTYVEINLAIGLVNAAGQTTRNDKIVPYNLVNTCTKEFFTKSKRSAWNWLQQKGVSGAQKGKKAPKSDAGTLRNIGAASTSSMPTRKAHGKAQAWQGSAEIHSAGKYQTTVAQMALTKMLDKAEKVSLRGKWGTDINNAIGSVEKQFRDYLEKEFDVKQYRDANTKFFDEEIVINLHATDAKGNSEFAKGKYDVPGIKKKMESHGKLIATNLAKQLGIKKNTDRWKDMQASKPRSQIMEAQVRKLLIEKLLKVKGTRPDFRLKVNKKLLQEALKDAKLNRSKKGTKLTSKKKKEKQKITTAKAGAAVAYRGKKSKGKSVDTARTGPSPIALRNMLNEALPQLVASKMTGAPTLQYRTGRFANSARVENVVVGPRGGVSVDYTYQRDPYETFEPGNKQGSTYRDPKRLIGGSIRELAIGILGKQPTTIRRT